jgi:hypothetical protein
MEFSMLIDLNTIIFIWIDETKELDFFNYNTIQDVWMAELVWAR